MPTWASLRHRLGSASTHSILNNGEFPFSVSQSTPRIKAGWFKLNLQRSKALSSTLVALYKHSFPCLLLVWNFPNDILLGKRIFNSHAYRSIWNTSMKVEKKVKVLVAQSCPALCNPMDCSSPGSLVCGILQARILEWVVIPFSRGSSWLRDRTQVSCIAGRFFTLWGTREPPNTSMSVCPAHSQN